MPRILLSNDDGIEAAGLQALARAFEDAGDFETWVVAPDREQSATSHAISLSRPLRIHEVAPRRYAVDGTPTDAVYLAINHVLKDSRPDIVVSGINHGPNLGNDVLYSGTVAAAMEGALLRVHAIAMSLASRNRDFSHAGRFAVSLARELLGRKPTAPVLLNVNVPGGPIKGYRTVRLGRRDYGGEVVASKDPRGRPYYWIGGDAAIHEDIPGSDCNCVFDEGIVSVTPLHLDMSHDAMLSELRNYTLEGFEKIPSP